MKKLYGIVVPMLTPMKEDGSVDIPKTCELTEWLIEKGVHCLYPCGSTGEMYKLCAEEREAVAEAVVKTTAGRVPVFVQTGAMTEEETIRLTRHAEKIGADGVGVVTPAYFACTDRELEEFYKRVARSVSEDFSVYLYNIPQCAANDITPQVARRLYESEKNIVGIKYSFLDIVRVAKYCEIEGFSVFNNDKLLPSMMVLGCEGTVSGIAQVFPEPFVEMYDAILRKDDEALKVLQPACREITDILQNGKNMAVFKYALALRGLPVGTVRKPHLDLTDCEKEELKALVLGFCERYGYKIEK